MPRPPAAPDRRVPYWLSVALSAALLGGITIAFVLFVLPQRYVLQGGLRASGVSFPTGAVPFAPREVTMRSKPAAAPGDSPEPEESMRLDADGSWDSTVIRASTASFDSTTVAVVPDTARDSLVVEDTDAAAALSRDQPVDTLEEARQAYAGGDVEQARSLYESAIASPDGDGRHDPDLLLEWADVLQFGLEDASGALDVLRSRSTLVRPTPEERFRMAQLMVWTGAEAEARDELLALLEEDSELTDAWALLGDLERWAGSRVAAASAYRTALALDSGHETAVEGQSALRADTERAVGFVDVEQVAPGFTHVSDSDGFRRTELRASSTHLPFPDVVSIEVGLRRIEGFNAIGAASVDRGGFVEGTLARWWREGGVRGSVTLGAEHLDLSGTTFVLGAGVQARELSGWNFDASIRSQSAQALTSTLESVAAGLRSNQLRVDLYRGLPASFELSATLDATRLSSSASDQIPSSSVDRLGSGVAVSRLITPWLRTGVTSRLVAFSDAAPIVTGRRLFWDPHAFWSSGVMVELRTPPEDRRVSAYLRSTPGIAIGRERHEESFSSARQLELEGGLRIHAGRSTLSADLFHARGREGGYASRGVNVGLEVRH
jgi:hypothetical protein